MNIKNGMQLLQAAQTTAAELLEVKDPLALLKKKMEAFDSLAVHESHWPDFLGHVDAALSAYQGRVELPIKPATPVS